jgi:H+/Cl- antiporter ClcA
VAECFRQEARASALAVCMFVNWTANLVLTLTFPYLASLLTDFVFLIFAVIVLIALLIIFKKVPETKGKDAEEIIAEFQGLKVNKDKTDANLI